MAPTHLAFLLHMHQPLYVDPATGQALLPWVRLHGARAYLDVARLLDEYPEVRLTVNFVPSLIEQLEAVVDGSAPADAWEEVATRPTGGWSAAERQFLVERFFSVAWTPNVEGRPRYRELLERRGRRISPEELPARTSTFSDGDLRDLTVLFHLAWLGFAAREEAPEIVELEAKGRGYDEQDLQTVLSVGRAACARVLPLYRKLAARGQVELATSPYYHPIVPLLCDSAAARRAQPALPLPDRYLAPDDARAQIALGRDAWRRSFGDRREPGADGEGPRGMWPPEGSLSPEAIAAYRAEGIKWLASDEGNLWRSLESTPEARAQRGVLYRPWRFEEVDLVFRDREISDRIGFSYAQLEAGAAVDDLLGRVRAAGEIGRAAGEIGRAAVGQGTGSAASPPLVSVILDGENPWEAYPGSGEPFLRTLFARLSERGEKQEIRAVTIGRHLDEHPGRGALRNLHSGSWIDSDFHIWIGDPVKDRAWNLLGKLRRRWQRVREVDPKRAAAARRHLLAAEGSDWFWWFGEPFHSAEDALFDRLFRAHLAAGWRALGEPPPDELSRSVAISEAQPATRRPRAFLTPIIDGRVGSYFEWIDAGRYEVGRGAAMADTPLVTTVHYGFDASTLYLRCDPAPGARPTLAAAAIELTITAPAREHHLHAGALEECFHVDEAGRSSARARTGQIACRDILEMSVPFSALGVGAGDRLELVLRLLDAGAGGAEVVKGRYPRDGAIELTVPDESFEADHWL